MCPTPQADLETANTPSSLLTENGPKSSEIQVCLLLPLSEEKIPTFELQVGFGKSQVI